ncbi:hypothetical protein BRADI_3g08715v3, partial [Brachypodium distachyon]
MESEVKRSDGDEHAVGIGRAASRTPFPISTYPGSIFSLGAYVFHTERRPCCPVPLRRRAPPLLRASLSAAPAAPFPFLPAAAGPVPHPPRTLLLPPSAAPAAERDAPVATPSIASIAFAPPPPPRIRALAPPSPTGLHPRCAVTEPPPSCRQRDATPRAH